MAVDWDNLTKDDVVWLHGWGRDSEIRAHGHGDLLDSYLESVEKGVTWEPNDMASTPAAPVASKLDSSGNRVSLENFEDGEDLPPYTEWSRPDLETECQERGLSTDGDDETLALRLLEDDDAAESAQQKSYSQMNKAALQEECRNRGLDDSGTVADLRARLQEDDATRGE